MNEKLERDLDEVHEALFGQFDVDRATGIVRGPYVKFPAYPYVGSRYGELKKLLFVGLDIGADETSGSVQSYESRRARIEGDSEHPEWLGPHMSGTYVTAMRLLAGENEEWRRWLEGADRELTPQALLDDTSRHPSLNPLSYIAFTNYFFERAMTVYFGNCRMWRRRSWSATIRPCAAKRGGWATISSPSSSLSQPLDRLRSGLTHCSAPQCEGGPRFPPSCRLG